MSIKSLLTTAAATGALIASSFAVQAQERIVLKSAKSTSSYYVMMVQLSEMLKQRGDFSPTVEESQGSVQNVSESAVRPGNFLFTTPPSLLTLAAEGKGPFEGTEPFDNARTLFAMPFVTIHFVARADSGVQMMSDFAGKTIIGGGVGTFCESRTKAVLNALGLSDKVTLIDVENNAINAAVRNGKVDGYSDCNSHPSTSSVELASTTDLVFVDLSQDERDTVINLDPLSGPITIAAGTYKGQSDDVNTVGVPVGAYGTTAMSDTVAYTITKTFWEQKDALAGDQRWWNGVSTDLVKLLGAKVHPGAAKYYEEAGIQFSE